MLMTTMTDTILSTGMSDCFSLFNRSHLTFMNMQCDTYRLHYCTVFYLPSLPRVEQKYDVTFLMIFTLVYPAKIFVVPTLLFVANRGFIADLRSACPNFNMYS